MLEKFTDRLNRPREMFAALPPTKKYLLMGILAAIIAGLIVMLVWTNKTEWGVLYTGLEQADAGEVMKLLNENKIPYQIGDDETTINVPAHMVGETRMLLATEGLPAGGSIGMEVFNETKIGETEFIQKLNYQRALQGELERTISKFAEINKVRVHLNIPKQSLFIEEERPTTASVVVSLKRGKSLDRSQLAGIVHLLAGSVEGLNPDNITVVDTQGGLLYSKDEEKTGLLTATQIELVKNVERRLTLRVSSILDRLLGPEQAMARVNADLNFKQITAREEIYDPDRTAIRSEQRLKEVNQGPARGAEGIPQSTFELGTGNEADQQSGPLGENYQRTEDTTNYEITKINREIFTPAGEIKRLSVAVMVDHVEEIGADGEPTGNYISIPVEELLQLEELVKSSIGFDQDRGDVVTVVSVPFKLPREPKLEWYMAILDLMFQHSKSLFNILLLVLFFIFVARPILSWLTREEKEEEIEGGDFDALPPGESEGEDGGLPEFRPGEIGTGSLTKDQILHLAQQDPERTLNLLRTWIEKEEA